MTHERIADQDEWAKLTDADEIDAQPLEDVPVGDLDPDAELDAMLAHDEGAQS